VVIETVPADIVSAFSSIGWFQNCGGDSDDGTMVPSWSAALAECSSVEWRVTTEEAQQRLTLEVRDQCGAKFDYWNDRARATKHAIVDGLVEPRIVECATTHDLSKAFGDCVRWDVLHAAMEMWHSDCVKSSFFSGLLTVYARGRFPCGWRGTWPNGEVMYF
jgi:hypothetical protein